MERVIQYLNLIKSRKSVRSFIYKTVNNKLIREILEFARWAPSGFNNQPWKVNLVAHPTIKRLLAENTKHGDIIEGAYCNIVVFYDLDRGYDRIKDIQACGAFMQNILLGINAINLGTDEKIGGVWLGEILNRKEKVNEIFKLSPKKFELMGIIALGYVDKDKQSKEQEERSRRDIDEFIEWY